MSLAQVVFSDDFPITQVAVARRSGLQTAGRQDEHPRVVEPSIRSECVRPDDGVSAT